MPQQVRVGCRTVAIMTSAPSFAPCEMAAALEGIWPKAARRRTGTATNPQGKVLPGQPMRSGWMQLWVQHAHRGGTNKGANTQMTCGADSQPRALTGGDAPGQPRALQEATLQALTLNEMSAWLMNAGGS
jgi:hypothetical protein